MTISNAALDLGVELRRWTPSFATPCSAPAGKATHAWGKKQTETVSCCGLLLVLPALAKDVGQKWQTTYEYLRAWLNTVIAGKTYPIHMHSVECCWLFSLVKKIFLHLDSCKRFDASLMAAAMRY